VITQVSQPTFSRYVHRNSAILGGEPVVAGTSIPVRTIIEMWRLGMSVEEIHEGLPDLTLAQIFDALSFYQDNVAEINAYIERNRITDAMIRETANRTLRNAA
jgi:uncharacterized protein (DUF433 family)